MDEPTRRVVLVLSSQGATVINQTTDTNPVLQTGFISNLVGEYNEYGKEPVSVSGTYEYSASIFGTFPEKESYPTMNNANITINNLGTVAFSLNVPLEENSEGIYLLPTNQNLQFDILAGTGAFGGMTGVVVLSTSDVPGEINQIIVSENVIYRSEQFAKAVAFTASGLRITGSGTGTASSTFSQEDADRAALTNALNAAELSVNSVANAVNVVTPV
jgi:hypothetical protein